MYNYAAHIPVISFVIFLLLSLHSHGKDYDVIWVGKDSLSVKLPHSFSFRELEAIKLCRLAPKRKCVTAESIEGAFVIFDMTSISTKETGYLLSLKNKNEYLKVIIDTPKKQSNNNEYLKIAISSMITSILSFFLIISGYYFHEYVHRKREYEVFSIVQTKLYHAILNGKSARESLTFANIFVKNEYPKVLEIKHILEFHSIILDAQELSPDKFYDSGDVVIVRRYEKLLVDLAIIEKEK